MSHLTFGYGFALFTALFVIAGDYALKVAADGDMALTSKHVLFGASIYAASAILWYFAMKHVSLAQAGVAYSMLTLLALCALGVVFFGETIGPKEALGVGFALLAMVLLSGF